jgi:dihydroorotate dehydrogenase electron transfer subunit
MLYKVVGKGTAELSEKRKGESLYVLGPLGKAFELSGSDKSSILVAGGIGVAPLFFLYQKNSINKVKFLAGFGSSDEIIQAKSVLDLEIDLNIATDDGSEGYKGMVTGLLNDYLMQKEFKTDFLSLYACGPLPMLKKVAGMAQEIGLYCYVSLETRMACGLGACQGCAVRSSSQGNSYLHVCKDGPVFSVRDIDWKNI